MNFKESNFEKERLILDNERVLTYSQLNCPLDCRYCFVEDINLEQTEGVTYLSEKQLELLSQLPEKIKLIMIGCDTEFFQSKKDSLNTLELLSNLKKDISIITKLSLSQKIIEKLIVINNNLKQNNNFLTFSMTMPCYDSAKIWEPKIPSPKKRIETLEKVHQGGIKTLVAIRPLLPTIPENELEKIVKTKKDYCSGYYSGPLYLKNLNHPLLDINSIPNLKIDKLQPHWMPNGNIFYRLEKEEQSNLLKDILQKYDKTLFEGAAEAIKYLRINEKY